MYQWKMAQQDDFLGGLHYDRVRDVQDQSRTGIVRYLPADDAVEPARTRVSPWWHVAGFVYGALAAGVAALGWSYGLDRFEESLRVHGLVAMGLAGLLVGLVSLGKLSPAAPFTAGVVAVAGSVLFELDLFPFLPVLRPLFESGTPVLIGVMLMVMAWRPR